MKTAVAIVYNSNEAILPSNKKRKMTNEVLRPPSRFVSIHNHSTFSPYDGLGQPQEHIDFCLRNGLDGWSLTDHGNGNGLAHAHGHAKKLYKKGQKFRQIFGVEFYFVPSLKEWRKNHEALRAAAADKKRPIRPEEDEMDSEDSLKPKIVMSEDEEADGDEEAGGLIVEDADETRSEVSASDVSKRYHLVVVAKNQTGLSNLFTLVKKSFRDGFYKFPRIDFELLKMHGEGLVVSSACVGGYPSGLIYSEFPGLKFNDLTPDLANDPAVMRKLVGKVENAVDRFVDCVGMGNFYLETQFHAIDAQDLTNRVLIETSKKTGVPLIATADSHYPGPDLWEAREMYRMLQPGRIKNDGSAPALPKIDELKALLYPKNADQMWQEFLKRREKFDWYQGQEDLVRTAIETGHDVAWEQCDQVWFDSAAKLPKFDNAQKTSFDQLRDLVKAGLTECGLDKKVEYVERAKVELADIKYLNFSDYFLTLEKVFKVAENRTLPGCGRGSGAGSLVNYLLGITHVDPVKYRLLFERFLNRQKASWPDIDTDVGDRDELIKAAQEIFGEESVVPVSNFNTLKLKSLVKDISKFYQVPFDEVNAVTGPLESEVAMLSQDPNMEKSMFVLKHEDCMKHSKRYNEFMTKYPQVEDKVKTLFMMNRSIGRHAGGVLICPDLEKHMPLITVRGELQTPWTEGVNIRNLEDNGFLKFDFLGLAQMKMVESCIRRIIRKEHNRAPRFEEIKAFYDEKLNSRYVEPNDPQVFKHVFKDGSWPGIFQFTSCLTGDTQITMSDGTTKRIDEVRQNDVVVSFNEISQKFESKAVSDFLDQGKKECIELVLENARMITCTLDHKFLTSNRGWVEAKDLTGDDDIIEYNP
jgi:DNA polymerase III alpha subunit